MPSVRLTLPRPSLKMIMGISGLVVEYIVAIDVTRVRFLADANLFRDFTVGSVTG